MLKRSFDFLCCLIALVILAPVFLVLAVVVKLGSRGPVFFAHERVGRNGLRFRLYKFRTMVANAASLGPPLTHGTDPRITRAGRLLRRWKLDELPQLLNVIKGDMSIVGPRPEVPKYVALYTPEQIRVLEVRPGITDLATLTYRDEESILQSAADPENYYIKEVLPAKLRLNAEYLEKQGFFFDLKLIGLTLWRIVKPETRGSRSDLPK